MEVEASNVEKTAVDAEETEFPPSQQDIALVVAACAGDLEEVQNLVKEDADICFQVGYAFEAIHFPFICYPKTLKTTQNKN
ncbi:unnamed protein product [Dibothriocephalus latus]|uniref:Uncharacterized protein n=1 Tax=Dibothriocephalus latus TaxID=60516 RepID=A0A3P7N408_DIBLA|nr:unnamed protein product [Dibothriocephalus latus]